MTACAIAVHNLTVAYRGHPAVHHLSGSFPAGTLSAVVGPNGAGKSTLLGALSGVVRNFEGRIERDPALRIAYLPQASALERGFPVRVRDVVATGLWPRIGSFGKARSDVVQFAADQGLIEKRHDQLPNRSRAIMFFCTSFDPPRIVRARWNM